MADESRQTDDGTPDDKPDERRAPAGRAAPDPKRDEFLRHRGKVPKPGPMPKGPDQHSQGGKGSRHPPSHHGARRQK